MRFEMCSGTCRPSADRHRAIRSVTDQNLTAYAKAVPHRPDGMLSALPGRYGGVDGERRAAPQSDDRVRSVDRLWESALTKC